MISKYFAWVRELTQSGLKAPTDSAPLQIDACWLEDRLLYSATALPIEMMEGSAAGIEFQITDAEVDAILQCINADLADTAPSSDNLTVDLATSDTTASNDLQSANLTALPSDENVTSSGQADASSADAGSIKHQVAFIDSSLDNLQDLIDQLQATYSDEDTRLDVVLLDNQSSGIHQITNYLAESDREYASIHLVTHGGSGQIQLGSDWLNLETLADQSQQLAMWQSSLTEDADLLIYACQTASTADASSLDLRYLNC